MSTLHIFAHPDIRKSRANKIIKQRFAQLPNCTTEDLYEKYPYFHIDVRYQQAQLLRHQLVVFQCPIYWYSIPPLLKLWFDLVFEHGFAYGQGGDKLKDKIFQMVITTGGDEIAYSAAGVHEKSFDHFLHPWIQTARLCKMKWQPPLVIHGAGKMSEGEIEAKANQFMEKILELDQRQ